MGSATEGMTPEEIQNRYHGPVSRFQDPPEGTFAAGRKPGQLTDDSTQMLEMLNGIVECQGLLTVEIVAKHLLRWAENEELYGRFSGPSTRRAIQQLKEGVSPFETGYPATPLDVVSNGAAMKVAPIGLAHPGDLEAAIRDATTMCIPTHNTDVAYAGASAVAAGIARALVPKASLLSVVDAAQYGARKGYEIGRRQARVISSPSLIKRLQQAVGIASAETDFEKTCQRLGQEIGCGLPIIETVPTAIGLFVAARGDPNRAVSGAVNLGGDADTVATIAGAISGALMGLDAVNQEWVETVEKVNHIDLHGYALKLVELQGR